MFSVRKSSVSIVGIRCSTQQIVCAMDEKRAFDAMLAEISDSDSDDGRAWPAASEPKASYVATSLNDRKAEKNQWSKEQSDIESFGSSIGNPSDLQSEQLSFTKRWLTRPCSRGERSAMKCFVERDRSTLGWQTTYRLFVEGSEGQPARFMMSAKKKVNKQTSYYLISVDKDPSDDRGSESLIGKVRGNTIGSRYLITDSGLAPDKTVAPSMRRKEFGLVGFEFDSGGPSRIEAWIPAVGPSNSPAIWQPESEEFGIESQVDARNFDRLFTLRNKTPKWDEAHGGHVLNFQGRVTESSVKNFQLCCLESEDPEDVVLQFGRVGKNKFTMDLKFPLSPLQAFGICVGCLDGKIADRKGYEYLRRLTMGSTSSSLADSKDQDRNSSDGNMKGSTSITGSLRESMPSGQYLIDKFQRTFK